jgi:hypothetical protein
VIQSSELDIHIDPTSYPSLSKSLKDYLSYQASLRYNLGEFPGVMTNWHCCWGEEIEAQLPWETTRYSFDDRQSLDTFSVVIIYLATP